MFQEEKIIPAARTEKEFEKLLESSPTYVVLLNSRLAQLKSMTQMAARAGKRLIVHADLIQGLGHDESAAQFLCQQVRPHGLISTRKQVLTTAKKHGLLTVQRMFLIDSSALETSYKIVEEVEPDVIEVLPGRMPGIIREVAEKTGVPLIAGGFLRSRQDAEEAFEAGAEAVTTTRRELWTARFDKP
ncbi:glycerol-3-phosphate responsive antiterminator [Salibacterium qingdaonense]|uniref:Glycerol uptake operon antiterminator regulatory protein n=1 Tax=Salibacterium qingdaonense TaxID=266892 RepID=A0A1I4JAU2_9BACI|nr:glycerol-3-phosphate responsive antiterminator [Salibacterium qingdaonense]SFL63236.1 glycerol uptake operon antiterminator [Salibacterium qingdaonense]